MGVCDSVSAIYMYLPRTQEMEWLNRLSLKRNLSTLGGRLSSRLIPKIGTRGLWSVLILIHLPRM